MPIGEALKVALASMSGQPIAIALLMVNVAFLVFVTMLMSDVATNASGRDRQNAELIAQLIQACKPRTTP
jgi:hypothetical protein